MFTVCAVCSSVGPILTKEPWWGSTINNNSQSPHPRFPMRRTSVQLMYFMNPDGVSVAWRPGWIFSSKSNVALFSPCPTDVGTVFSLSALCTGVAQIEASPAEDAVLGLLSVSRMWFSLRMLTEDINLFRIDFFFFQSAPSLEMGKPLLIPADEREKAEKVVEAACISQPVPSDCLRMPKDYTCPCLIYLGFESMRISIVMEHLAGFKYFKGSPYLLPCPLTEEHCIKSKPASSTFLRLSYSAPYWKLLPHALAQLPRNFCHVLVGSAKSHPGEAACAFGAWLGYCGMALKIPTEYLTAHLGGISWCLLHCLISHSLLFLAMPGECLAPLSLWPTI